MFFFSALCLVASSSLHYIVISVTSLCCADFFVCFYRNGFCSPPINQISLSQSKGWFPFILLYRQEKYHWIINSKLQINYTNRISELHLHMYLLKIISIWQILIKIGSHIKGKLIWLNKNISHWRVETGLKDGFIMYYFLWEPSVAKIVNYAINLSQLGTI